MLILVKEVSNKEDIQNKQNPRKGIYLNVMFILQGVEVELDNLLSCFLTA